MNLGVPLNERFNLDCGFLSLNDILTSKPTGSKCHFINPVQIESFESVLYGTSDFNLVEGEYAEFCMSSGRVYRVGDDSSLLGYKNNIEYLKASQYEEGDYFLLRSRSLVPSKLDIGAFNSVLAHYRDSNNLDLAIYRRIPIQRVAAIIGLMQRTPIGATTSNKAYITLLSDLLFSVGIIHKVNRIGDSFSINLTVQSREIFNEYLNFVNKFYNGEKSTESANLKLMSITKSIDLDSFLNRDNLGKVTYGLVADKIEKVTKSKGTLCYPEGLKGFMLGSLHISLE